MLRPALDGCRAAQGSAHPNCLFIASNLSDAYTRAGQHAEASTLLAEIVPLGQAREQAGNWRIKRLLMLAEARHALAIGERERGRALATQLLHDLATLHGDRHPEYLRLRAELLKG